MSNNGYIINISRRPFTSSPEYNEPTPNGAGVFIGHYDNFELFECNNISEFFFGKKNVKTQETQEVNNIQKIAGEKQSIYLYHNTVAEDEGNVGASESEAAPLRRKRICKCSGNSFYPKFVFVTIVSLSEEAKQLYWDVAKRSKTDDNIGEAFQKQLYENLDKTLTNLVKEKGNSRLYYEILSSLGSGDFGILWFSNNLEQPAHILSQLRKTVVVHGKYKKLAFFSDYTVVSVIPSDKNAGTPENPAMFSGSDSDLELQISLTVKNLPTNADKDPYMKLWKDLYYDIFQIRVRKDNKEFVKWLKESIVSRCFNQDYIIRLKCSETPLSVLNNSRGAFKKYTLGAHTRIVAPYKIPQSIEDAPILLNTENVVFEVDEEPKSSAPKSNIATELAKLVTLTDRLIAGKKPDDASAEKPNNSDDEVNPNTPQGKVNRFFTSNSHICETIYKLNCDIARCVTTMSNFNWAEDLVAQYKAFLQCAWYILSEINNENREDAVTAVRNLINAMQQNCRHITNGSRVFFDVPGTDLPYNGSFRKIIWTYYGIIKHYIRIAYSIRRTTTQKQIIPILEFSHIPTIKAQQYEYIDCDGESVHLVIYTMPYASFTNMPKFAKFLAHEVHHTFGPADRIVRNKILGVFVIQDLYFTLLMNYRAKKEGISLADLNRNTLRSDLIGALRDVCFTFAIENYQTIARDSCPVGSDENPFESLKYRELAKSIIDAHGERTNETVKLNAETSIGIFVKYLDNLLVSKEGHSDSLSKLLLDFFPKEARENLKTELVSISKFWSAFDSSIFIIEGFLEACHDYFMLQLWRENIHEKDIHEKDIMNYLDFMSDFFYATQLNPENDTDTDSILAARIGAIISIYLPEHSDSNGEHDALTSEKRFEEIANAWKERNKGFLKKRLAESRDTNRIEYRIGMCSRFKAMYNNFLCKIPHTNFLLSLLRMVDFNYIETNLNLENTTLDNEKQEEFLSYVMAFRDFSKKYNNIQSSDNSKKERAAKQFELHKEIFNFYSFQHSLDSIKQDWVRNKRENKPNYIFCAEKVKGYFHSSIESTVTGDDSNAINHSQKYILKYNVSSYDGFFTLVGSLLNEFRGDHQTWFRGQANAAYDLRPGTLRPGYKDDKVSNKDESYFYQQGYFDHFLAKGSYSLEIGNRSSLPYIDYIAAMQHYNVPTNLLDWSEMLFTAMYFAFEPMLLHKYYAEGKSLEMEKRVKAMEENGVAIYLFNPVRYNIAWKTHTMKTIEKIDNLKDNVKPKCPLAKNKLRLKRFSIPNLSVTESAKIFSPYVLGQTEAYTKCALNVLDENCVGMCVENETCPFRFPISIFSGQSSARLKGQSGTFTAFSLHDGNKCYKETLEQVQEYFLKKDLCNKPFLYKIVIDKPALASICEWIHLCGVRKFGIYPELHNIGDHVTDFHKQQIDKGTTPHK